MTPLDSPNWRRLRRSAVVVVAACSLMAVEVSPSSAALPPASSRFEAHSHRGRDTDYHLDMRVSRDPRILESVFVHYTGCSQGVTTRDVPIGEDGSVSISRRFTPDGSTATDSGEFSLNARFTSPYEAAGTYRIVIPGCDSGERSFTARRQGSSGGHDHSEPYPNFRAASRANRARAVRLWRATLRNARRFNTPREARRAGFVIRDSGRRPAILHWNKHGTYLPPVLRARSPESLVYWHPASGRPVLIAFMYRTPLRPQPPTWGGILDWHTHRNGISWMTHVWLTRDRRSAFARCLPVQQLERSLRAFRPGDQLPRSKMHNLMPCPPDDA
jgi:hypothetical protein